MNSAASSSCTFLQLVFLLTVFSHLLQGCSRQEAPSYGGPPTKITIGIYKGEATALLYAAEMFGYLKQMGIQAEFREFDSGVAAVAALNEGSVDLATAADFVFVSNIEKHPDLRLIASINSSNNTYMVARRDKGVLRPADLKGKRIAVTRTSVAEYFLEKYLNANRMRSGDISIIYISPTEMEKEIAAGSIDAVMVWDPVARRIKERLGTNAASWPAQAESSWHAALIVRSSLIRKEPAALVRLMKALIMTEKSVANDPAAVQLHLAKRFGMPEKYFADIWGDNRFKVSLDRSLLLTLEEESRWIRKMQGATGQKLPNFLQFLYLDALEAARLESVTIIH